MRRLERLSAPEERCQQAPGKRLGEGCGAFGAALFYCGHAPSIFGALYCITNWLTVTVRSDRNLNYHHWRSQIGNTQYGQQTKIPSCGFWRVSKYATQQALAFPTSPPFTLVRPNDGNFRTLYIQPRSFAWCRSMYLSMSMSFHVLILPYTTNGSFVWLGPTERCFLVCFFLLSHCICFFFLLFLTKIGLWSEPTIALSLLLVSFIGPVTQTQQLLGCVRFHGI